MKATMQQSDDPFTRTRRFVVSVEVDQVDIDHLRDRDTSALHWFGAFLKGWRPRPTLAETLRSIGDFIDEVGL